MIHGLSDAMTKGEFLLKHGKCTLQIMPRIAPDDKQFGEGYAARTPRISRWFKAEFDKLRQEVETPSYFNPLVRKNFVYKGPVLEWYVRVKLMMEKNYQLFHQLLPRRGTIYDVGCGYGYVSLMLNLCAEDRRMIGIDMDEEKIAIAQNLPSRKTNVLFDAHDVRDFGYQEADAFLVSDVLHYMRREEQEALLQKFIDKLNPGGIILIRDADSDDKENHEKSRRTERWSTGLGFNKAKFEDMEFLSGASLMQFFEERGLQVRIEERSGGTSNTLFIAEKRG